MKKQLLLFILTLLPMLAMADDSGSCGENVTYTYNSTTKTLTIQGSGEMDYYLFYPTPWNSYYTDINTVIIEEGVTSIGYSAFSGCIGLTSVTIPNSVTSIGNSAFRYCSGLTSVTIPNSVTSIRYMAFYSCSGLTSVTIGNSVMSIGNEAFSGCSSLTSVTIPNSVTSIGNSAFEGCSGLTSVYIGNSVTSIGYEAFYNCSGLQKVIVPDIAAWCGISFGDYYANPLYYAHHLYSDENTEIKELVIPDGVTSIGSYVFSGCSGLTSVTIPNSVTSIGESAFGGCSGLTSVIIPNSVTSIGSGAFYGCTSMSEMYCYAQNVPAGNNIFNNSNYKNATLYVPKKSLEAYRGAAQWKDFGTITRIVLPSHILKYVVDGEDYKVYEVEEETEITPEPTPTKEGYTFSGWSEIPETMPAYDVTVTGTFSINKYKLTYKVDGVEYKSYELEYGAEITPEPAPTKEGYTFSGWSEIPETMPAYDVTVTGSFAVNQYLITYMIGDEVYQKEYVDYGATIVLPNVPEREGYSFAWIDAPEKMPAHDITINGAYTSGILGVSNDDATTNTYTISGYKTDKPRRGVNIIRMSDGTTRKVVVK